MSSDVSTPAPPAEAAPKRSAVEGIKEASQHLRGTIALELVADADHFSEANKQLLKFHGSYQQEDRDARKNRAKAGVGKHHMFMVRCKMPGGKLTADQYLAVDDLAGRFANGTIRFTTRQGIQFHGILKDNLKPTIAGINECLLSTLGACGDVNRNVMACPAPIKDEVHAAMQALADTFARHFAPRSNGYHEIWLDGEKVNPETEVEPIYGDVYLPRKFKTAVALPDDNCVDIHANDLGFLAIVEGGRLAGYNVLVGGGMGRTHGNHNTFAHLSVPVAFVTPAEAVAAGEAVLRLFRDHGNRADRKRARLKYVVHDWGVEKFRDVLAGYLGRVPDRPRDVWVTGVDLHLGWHPQGDGKWWLGVSVENGRVKDEGRLRLRTALREIVTRFRPNLRVTGQQDVLVCDLEESVRAEVDRILEAHGVVPEAKLSPARKWSMACPAIPTCGLAISESERALPGLIDELEVALRELGLSDEPISVRMTGCPNGCARPYQSDVGLVGRSGDKYTVYVGGSVLGSRLNFPLKDLVPRGEIVPMLKKVLADYRANRRGGEESFGDYCHRQGAERLAGVIA